MRSKIVWVIAIAALVTVLGLAGCGGGGQDKSGEPGSRTWNVAYSATTATLALTFDKDGKVTGTLTPLSTGISVAVTGSVAGKDAELHSVAPDGVESTMKLVFDGDAVTGTVKIWVPGHPESNLAAPFDLTGTRTSWVPGQSSSGPSLAGSWQVTTTIDGESEVDAMVLRADGSFTIGELPGTYTVSASHFAARTQTYTGPAGTAYYELEGTVSGDSTIDGTQRLVATSDPGHNGSFHATKM
jgi:hypothetical protein